MPLRPWILRVALQASLPWTGVAQTLSVPSDSLLAGITARGRLLAAYDQAAWHATDALVALRPDSSAIQAASLMVALRQSDATWKVLFGRLSAAGDSFYLAYEALPAGRPDSFTIQRHAPPTALVGAERQAATALRAARADFGTSDRPYNAYVLPRGDGHFWVYFLPAQTDWGAFPHGADVRYLLTVDPIAIVDKHPMHRALLNLAVPDSAISGLHTVLVDDVPQDSDVFLVLVRRPPRRELIATEHYDYEIALDGSITWRLGDRGPER